MEFERQQGGLRTKNVFKSSKSGKPLVSVVTIVFNGESYLEETIQSVINQDYENLEYIIVDGGSRDRSVEIIKKYEDRIDYWVSEKDKGISDAFNKGVLLAAGDYINFQGDGDGFLEKTSVKKLFEGVDSEKYDLVCGRVRRTAMNGAPLFDSPVHHFSKRSLLFRMSLPHQGLFTHKRFFKKYGLFDQECKFAMDYDHLLRAYAEFPVVWTSPVIVAKWRLDGVGNGRTADVLKEYDRIKRKNKVAPEIVLTAINGWSYLKFWIKSFME